MVKFVIKQNKEIRDKGYLRIINKKIQTYISNGCIGNLDLEDEPITKLPNNLKYIGGNLYIRWCDISELPSDIIIHGSLWCRNTPLSRKYSKKEINSKWNIHGKVILY